MGCDFYILVYIEIEIHTGISYYELPEIRGWFPDGLGSCHSNSDCETDEDEEIKQQYESVYDAMTELCLTPRKPFVLYENGKFISKKVEKKYLPFLHKKLEKKYASPWENDDDEDIYIQKIILKKT